MPLTSQKDGVQLGTDPACTWRAKVRLGLGAVLILVLLPLRKLRYTGEEGANVSSLGSI